MNLRQSLLASIALLTALTAPALAQTDQPVKLPLAQIKPTELLQMLLDTKEQNLLPSGITMISPDDEKQFLAVKGTTEAVNTLREIARLVDVPKRTMRLEARILLQNPLAGEKGPKPEVVATATMVLTNNREGEAFLVGQGRAFRFQMTPHLNGDGSITISTRFADKRVIMWASDDFRAISRDTTDTTRRIAPGQPKVLAGFAIGNIPSGNDIKSFAEINVPMYMLEVKLATIDTPAVEGKNTTTDQRKPQKQTAK